MSNTIHKGTEHNNIKETWDQNEKEGTPTPASGTISNDLDEIIKEEAAEYDEANKEERTLGGDRASVNDE